MQIQIIHSTYRYFSNFR